MNGGSESTRELGKRIRIHSLRMTSKGRSSHIGAALSVADILAVLYGEILRYDPDCPEWDERDRFILSKGHAGVAVYAALAETGFFPIADLDSHYQDGSLLSGHISHKGIPGVEISTGSLGHGLGVGVGMAKALSLRGSPSRVFVVLSDGECDEGSTWEAAMFAGHHRLGKCVAIIDYNKIQSLDTVENTLDLEPFVAKWQSFNWSAVEVDGHDHEDLGRVIRGAESSDRPTAIIAHTIKGKGVSFMENTVLWHYRSPMGDEFDAALKELECS